MRLIHDINAGRRTLSALFAQSSSTVVFTGAGMSTESGIPDFRSPGGLWSRMKPIEFNEFVASPEARLEDWRRRFEMNEQFAAALPNAGHLAIAQMMRAGRIASVITQNIDGLHQRAGCAHERVIELHGNSTYGTCLDCGAHHALESVRAAIKANGSSPRCQACDGLVKAAVISFGQAMPKTAMQRAADLAQACDLFVVAGSSLQVQPAASLPLLAVRHGATLVIVNREETALDDVSQTILRGSIGEFLGGLAETA